jgi:hypothetical protein
LILDRLKVPEPQNCDPTSFEIAVTTRIDVLAFRARMAIAIQLDREFGLCTVKIEYVWAPRVLPTELESREATIPH